MTANVLALLWVASMAFGGPTQQFETALWPGEGRPRFQAAGDELALREAPTMSSPIVRRPSGVKGKAIAFDETRYRTVDPGQLRVLTRVTMSGRVLGPITHLSREDYYHGRASQGRLELGADDVIEYLQDRAEGSCFVRVDTQVIDTFPCPAYDERVFRVLTKPKIEWWIRMVLKGAPVGWILVEDSSLKLVDRQF